MNLFSVSLSEPAPVAIAVMNIHCVIMKFVWMSAFLLPVVRRQGLVSYICFLATNFLLVSGHDARTCEHARPPRCFGCRNLTESTAIILRSLAMDPCQLSRELSEQRSIVSITKSGSFRDSMIQLRYFSRLFLT